jgi:D-alanine-D-alanine ligase
MDKVATKRAWEDAALPTPPYKVVTATDRKTPLLDSPCVVKAISSGSSIDVFVCKKPSTCAAEAKKAVDMIVGKHGRALVEKFINGAELTVGLLMEEPLAPIRIVPRREFFDYEAKYKASDTEHRFDLGLPDKVVQQVRELARQANAVVGARDLARIDVMLDDQNNPFLLEINTLPGFTPNSLLPEAAKHNGIEFGPLVDQLVRRALGRSAKCKVQSAK